MKKIFFLLVLILSSPSLISAQNMTFDDGTTWNCDQNFAPVPLRYQYQYEFYDVWNNPSNIPVYMNTRSIQYKNAGYLNMGQMWPNGSPVYWTNELVNNGYSVPANSSMKVLSTFADDWAILSHPLVRTTNDFTIAYKVGYDFSNNYPDASDDIEHVECQPYYITWCGDGVLDSAYEACDPNDTSHARWGNGECNIACQIASTGACIPGPTTGPQTNPVTNTTPGLCPAGQTAVNFTTLQSSGATINYKWSCMNGANVSPEGGACIASYTPSTNGTGSFDLSIKKYIETNDAQPGSPVTMLVGSGFNYVIRVRNEGPQSTTGTTTMKDILPAGITANGLPTGSGWSCNYSGSTLSCTSSQIIPSGQSFPDIIVPTRVYNLTTFSANSTSQFIPRNAKAINVGSINVRSSQPNSIQYIDIAHSGLNSGMGNIDKIQLAYSGLAFPATVTTVGSTYRLTFTTPLSISGDVSLNLIASFSGQANEQHIFTLIGVNIPANSVIGSGLNLTVGLINTTTAVTGSGGGFAVAPLPETANPTIIGTTVTSIIQNNALVHNPNESNPCFANNSMPLGSEAVCTRDSRNTDPAVLQILGVTPPFSNIPICNALSGAPTASVAPNTSVALACSSLGFTGNVANLEYQINCGTSTLAWTSSNTGTCNALPTNAAVLPVSCGVRDRTSPNTIFSGSFAGSCRSSITTTSGGGGGGGGGVAIVGKICVNGIASCATYNSINACTAAGIPANLCYDADIIGQNRCRDQVLSCSSNGGTSGGGGRCGDGVLQIGEECDVVGAAWCVSCQLQTLTNPGANPVTSLWMTIPILSKARLGIAWLDETPGRLPFEENRMVLGVRTRAFTLADTIGFGIKTKYALPLIIEADKKICLKSSGTSLNSETLCTTFGDAASYDSRVTTWIRPVDGKAYVILGKGDFQYQRTLGGPYYVEYANSSNAIDLFKGARQYSAFGGGSPTLNSSFFGRQIGEDGILTLATTSVDLVSLPVRVSRAILGTTTTPANRSIENFLSSTSVRDFLSSIIKKDTTLGSTTTLRNDNSPVGTLLFSIPHTGSRSVKNLSELESLAVNGNKNLLAVRGDLTIENCTANTFLMDAIRTVVVEGNIIIKCNIVYGSSDMTSSFAWISIGGNIVVDPGVSNNPASGVSKLSGVYVTITKNNIGGVFQSLGNATSTRILKIDGSLYGNATPLLSSRLYARGTSAYEILTTGTIITYSNRALVNPPPLLREYLGNYSVERVVK